MSQLVKSHHSTTLSGAMLSGERRVITTHHGFRINVPVPTKHLGEVRTVRQWRGVGLTRQVEALVNRGISVRLPLARLALRIYGHQIRKAEVYALARLRRFHDGHGQDEFAHLRDFNGPRHGNWARLRWWGLIEPKPEAEGQSAKDVRGWWRLTGRGFAFLRGDEKVPRTALIFDGSWIGWRDTADKLGPQDVDPTFTLESILMRRGA